MRFILFPLIVVILGSCGLMERRDFAREMGYGQLQHMGEPAFMANRDFMVVAGDNGRDYRSLDQIRDRTPATARTQEERRYYESLSRELIILENGLNDQEYNEYLKYKGHFGTVSEKIYFLRLSPSKRSSYLSARGINPNINVKSEGYSSTMQRDVLVGMGKSDVLGSWGRPISKEVSGNPADENERWAFYRGSRVKYIYFEGGKVSGWTTE